jgi:hypothetical protein
MLRVLSRLGWRPLLCFSGAEKGVQPLFIDLCFCFGSAISQIMTIQNLSTLVNAYVALHVNLLWSVALSSSNRTSCVVVLKDR